MNKLVTALSIAGLFSVATFSHANPQRDGPGWSGLINLNVGYASGTSQLSTDDDNAVTADLNNSGKSTSAAIVYPLVRVAYTTQDLKNQFFLGNSQENVTRAQFQYELGYTRQLSKRSNITVAYFPELPLFNETWADPFLTGVAREKTEENYQGGRIEYKAIADSPFSLKYAYAKRSVENEKSGQSLGLSSQQLQSLRRPADLHRLTAELFFPVSRQLFLQPAFVYTTAKADGAAEDFDDYTLRLTTIYRQDQHFLNFNLELGSTRYGAENPVFSETQKNTNGSIFALYAYDDIFGWENVVFNALGGYSNTSSNINFYDSKGIFAAVGLGYKF